MTIEEALRASIAEGHKAWHQFNATRTAIESHHRSRQESQALLMVLAANTRTMLVSYEQVTNVIANMTDEEWENMSNE